MTLPASGILGMDAINAEFGRGLNIGAYLSTPWWTDAGASGNFSPNNLGYAEFYGKRGTPPIANGLISVQGNGGSGPTWDWTSGLGVEHPNRVIVAAVSTGDTTGSPVSIRMDGTVMTLASRSTGTGSMRACAIYYSHAPTGTSAAFSATNGNNASGAILAVYAIYPASPTHVSADSGNTTSTFCNAALTLPANGWGLIVHHHRNSNLAGMGGTLVATYTTHYSDVFGGVAMLHASMVNPAGSSGNAQAGWSGAVNGTICGATWGPM